MPYRLLADLVLTVHFLFVAFVVLGLLLIWVGFVFRWGWVRNFWFRIAHLGCMALVVTESAFDVICPLTTWEHRLRVLAGQAGYEGVSFMQHWIHKVMFFQLSPTTFLIIYIVFFAALVLSLILVRPRAPSCWKRSRAKRGDSLVPR